MDVSIGLNPVLMMFNMISDWQSISSLGFKWRLIFCYSWLKSYVFRRNAVILLRNCYLIGFNGIKTSCETLYSD